MSEFLTVVLVILTSVGSAVAAVSNIIKPMKKQIDDIVAKEIEKEKEEQRMKSLEGWTESQQEDLEAFNEGLIIVAGAVAALLDHVIEKQNGNGKCHQSREDLQSFLRKKALGKKSHKIQKSRDVKIE